MHELKRELTAGAAAGSVSQGIAAMAELSDGVIGIRRFCGEDVAALSQAIQESLIELCRWMVWCRLDYGHEDCAKFIAACEEHWQEGSQHSFGVVDQRDGRLLGSVGFSEIDRAHKTANLGYWIRTGRTRKGAATAAARLAARYAFTNLNLERVELLVPIENRASLRVAENAGAVFEGVLKKKVMLGGRSHDAAIYAFVRETEVNR
jgi:ribosomal-protein-serine acetyltransferase